MYYQRSAPASVLLVECLCQCIISGVPLPVYYQWSAPANVLLVEYPCWCIVSGVPLPMYCQWSALVIVLLQECPCHCIISGVPLPMYCQWSAPAGVLLVECPCQCIVSGVPLSLYCYRSAPVIVLLVECPCPCIVSGVPLPLYCQWSAPALVLLVECPCPCIVFQSVNVKEYMSRSGRQRGWFCSKTNKPVATCYMGIRIHKVILPACSPPTHEKTSMDSRQSNKKHHQVQDLLVLIRHQCAMQRSSGSLGITIKLGHYQNVGMLKVRCSHLWLMPLYLIISHAC